MTRTPRTTGSRNRRTLAALVAAALAITACGNSGDDDAEQSSAEDTAEEPTDDTADDTTEDTVEEPAEDTAEEPTDDTAEDTAEEPVEAPSDEPDLGEFQPIEGVPGVTDEAINFAVLGTGPANPLGYCLLECYLGGVQAYFDWRNSIGGVHGRDLVIAREDDDELANGQVKFLEIAGDDNVFGVLAAPLIADPAAFGAAADAGMPLYTTFPSSTAVIGVESSFVPGGLSCIDCSNPMTVWAATLTGKSKIAGLGLGASQASKDCVDNTQADIEKFGPGAGVEWAYKNNDLPFGLPNGLGPEVTAMADAGVDYIATCLDQNSALVAEQELERQGLADVVVDLPQGYGDVDFITSNADVLEGSVLGTPFRPFEADPAGTMLSTMSEWIDQAGVLRNDFAIEGWLGADLAVTGLLAAGPQFDRAGVIDATNALTDYDAGGIMPPVDWATGHTSPGADGEPFRFCLSLLQIRGGSLELLGDPAEPWYCFDGPLDEWTEPYTLG